jgi:ribosome-binding factor A
MNQRLARIREQLKEEVSDIIRREVRDPRIGFLTITDADISADLRHAKVFYTVLGDQTQIDNAQEALNSAAGLIRSQFGQRVRLKFTPEITFHFDSSVQRAARIEELLNQIARESMPPSEDDPTHEAR